MLDRMRVGEDVEADGTATSAFKAVSIISDGKEGEHLVAIENVRAPYPHRKTISMMFHRTRT